MLKELQVLMEKTKCPAEREMLITIAKLKRKNNIDDRRILEALLRVIDEVSINKSALGNFH